MGHPADLLCGKTLWKGTVEAEVPRGRKRHRHTRVLGLIGHLETPSAAVRPASPQTLPGPAQLTRC